MELPPPVIDLVGNGKVKGSHFARPVVLTKEQSFRKPEGFRRVALG